eukprot:gene5121-5361_t
MAEDFSRAVARVVAAQIAESASFDASQDSAIEILADLLLRYLTTVCASSHSYAELAGRSQSNLADVLLALEELGGTDIPFAHTLAPYPVHCQRPVAPTFADQKEAPPAHIPAFLPAFPDPHTYQHTAAFSGHEADPYKQRQSMLEAKQKAEAALNKLHQRMSSKKTAQPNSNPFLEPPEVGAAAAQQPLAAAIGPQGYGTVGWRSSEDVAAPVPAAAGVIGSSSAELLCSGIDPLAAGKRTLFTLSSQQRPADVYAERLQMRAGAGRQRKSSSRSDGDPKVIQAKGILEAGPEAVFAAAGAGSSSLHDMFDVGDGLDGR